MIEVHDIFIESIFKTVYENIDHQKIKEYIDFLMSKSETGVIMSNKGGWQYHVLPQECEAIDYLAKRLTDTAHQILYENYNYDVKELRVSNIWINVNRSGDYNVNHTHTGALLSCVYYVDTPEPLAQIELEASDYFQRQVLMNELEQSNAEIVNKETNHLHPRTNYARGIIPESRQALFFNGSLTHRVDINNSTEPRISIAANFISS